MAVSTNSEHAHVDSSRRSFLKGAGALAVAGSLTGWPTSATASTARRRTRRADFPIRHVVIDCQENRSFDHYYGHAPWIGSYGIPPGYSVPDGIGGTVKPFHLKKTTSDDIDHEWSAIHREWNFGQMDGFYTTDGRIALGYYTAQDLPFYYSLFANSTLA